MNLRHRIRLEAGTPSQDGTTGEVTDAWGTFADNVPAEIRPLSGRELIAAQAELAEVSAWITIRWMPGVLPSMRVVHDDDGGRVYNVRHVKLDDTQRRWITMLCTSGLNEG